MKVIVHAYYNVHESFEINVESEDEIRDKAWDFAYDYTSKYGVEEPVDVDWEILDEEDE